MKNTFLFSLASIFIFCNCSSDEEKLIPSELKWRYVLESIGSETAAFIYDPIIYEDIVVIPRQSFEGHKAELIALNKYDGEVLWTWSEAFDKYNKDGFSVTSHEFDGILAIGDNNYTAAIDILTGETLWENIENVHSLTAINGVEEQIFKSAYIEHEKYWIQKANIYTGDWETIFTLNKEEGLNLGSYTPIATEWEGKTYITFLKINWRSQPNYESSIFLHLYNITDDSLAWKTDTIPLDHSISHTPGRFPAFNEGQILIANEAIYSYNMTDGKLKWKKSYDNSFTIGTNLAAENGKVYANNGDGYFLCLDVQTGSEIFRTPSGGSPSTIEIYDNKCYMSAVTTNTQNQFMVIDANNGSVIHALRSPFEQEDDTAVLQWALTVDKESGLAYTADYKNFLCYDFE